MTFLAGQKLRAIDLSVVENNVTTLQGQMTGINLGDEVDYIPVWSTSGTAPAIGNGQLAGRYSKIGKRCDVSIIMIAGSTTTFGTGEYIFTLPFTAKTVSFFAGSTPVWFGSAQILDAGTAYFVGTSFIYTADNKVRVNTNNAGGFVQNTTPQTWAINDRLGLSITYYTV